MKIIVNPHKLEIEKSPVNEKEINITKCKFEFSEEISNDYVKEAYFKYKNNTYKQIIVNNECDIPSEVLEEKGQIEIGVVAFLVENEEEIKRYNPSPVYITTWEGSLKDAENTEPITPTDKEQMEQAIQDMEVKIDNLDIDAEKVDKTTTVTITKKDGTQEEVEILDGEDGTSLESIEIKNRDLYVTYGGSESDLGQVAPNIQIGTTTTGSPSTPASVVNVGTDLNPILNFTIPKGEAGSIKFEIVEQLPTQDIKEDTIYLVPYTKITVQTLPTENIQLHTIYIVESTGKRYVYNGNEWIEISSDNQYVEYVYINNSWEELGSIGVDINLDDYYTKTETNTLLDAKVNFTDYPTNDGTKSGVIKVNATDGISINTSNNRLQAVNTDYGTYQSASNSYIIGKGTLENVISGKGLVSNTDYASTSNAGVIKTSNYWAIGTQQDTGNVYAIDKTYSEYTSGSSNMFISKGTLENVITGKDLTTKSYVDGLVGDIGTILDNINGESL